MEIKKAEPRDGSTNSMMQIDPAHSINAASHWGNPMISNGGPMMSGPIGMPNIGNAGFNYNYGSSTPNNPSFGWPQHWGGNNSYGLPPHQAGPQQSAQGYGGYDYNGPIGYNSTAPGNYSAANGSSWNSWNPNLTSIPPNTGSSSGEMYRPQSGHNMHSGPPPSGGNLSKPGSEYNGGAYTNYYNEQHQFNNQNRPRSYGNNEQYPAF